MKVYPSKVGWGLLVLVLVSFGVGIYFTFEAGKWIDFAIQIGILLVVVLLFNSISYKIDDKNLVVKTFFWFKKEIPVDSITGIVETNTLISAPAASLDRLEVLYGKYKSVIISPKDKMGFIEHLKLLSPSIVVKMKKRKD
ncbi:PH domain-containing protein [Flagellimonas marina]|uniref:PH domain-containing protein n=1 Tax=Flagellimonas marina TaxID=1775168 RepID=A0ABV8PLY3_9FLAO